jgi:HTH-type transcriptional regulator / antitoxin HigA
MTNLRLAEIVAPGEFIKDGLESKGWTQIDLAEVMGRTPRHVNEIINGKIGITPRTARELAAAFETTPEFWLNLDNQYQLAHSNADDEAVSRRARLYRFPIRAMIKRGWIEKTDDLNILEHKVTSFFGVGSIEEVEQFRHAARRSTGDEVSDIQLAWLYRVRQVAMSMHVPPYDEGGLSKAIDKLSALRSEVREIRHVPRILQEAGIRFVLVEAPEGSKIDGVCFWLKSSGPVIGMSLRFDRIDNFWFVLRHELEHVKCGHGKSAYIIDVDLEDGGDDIASEPISEEERIANSAAAEFCVNQSRMKSFIARKQPYISERDVLAFAKICNVHPGIIVGQLHRNLNNYKNFRSHLVSISRELFDNAVVDGWGQTALI